MGKKLTQAKARKILHDKSVHGNPLTEKQRKFFGAIAGGAKPYKAEEGGWLDKYEAQGGANLPEYARRPMTGDIAGRTPELKKIAEEPKIRQLKEEKAEEARRKTTIGPDKRTAAQKEKDRKAAEDLIRYEEEVLGKDFSMPSALRERNRAEAERIISNLDIPLTLMGVGELAYGAGKLAAKELPKISKALTASRVPPPAPSAVTSGEYLRQLTEVVDPETGVSEFIPTFRIPQTNQLRRLFGQPSIGGTTGIVRPNTQGLFGMTAEETEAAWRRLQTQWESPSSWSQTSKPIVTNKSGLTKEEVLEKLPSKDKDVISKMSEEEFQETVMKPTGEIVPYYQGPSVAQFKESQGVVPMTTKEYVDAFNERLDLLNDIIAQKNKSGVDYRVKKLTPEGSLIFETPEQYIPRSLEEDQKVLLEMFRKDPEKYLLDRGLTQTSDGRWTFKDDDFSETFATKKEAIDFAKQKVEDIFLSPKKVSGETSWQVSIWPGQWRGEIQDIANRDYFRSIPGIDMSNTASTVFADRMPRRGSAAYESINEYLKRLDLGRVKPGFNSQTSSSRGAWENFIKTGRGVGYYANPSTVYGTMKTITPLIGLGYLGSEALQQKEEGGWLDKYKEGGELKQKKNDNYGVQGNYNDYNISLPKGFKGWAYNTKGRNYSPAWGGQFQSGGNLTADSVKHQANKILKYEQLRGGPGGAPLPQYADVKYMDMLMNKIYPEIKKILPNASAMEIGEAMDFVFNAGWDQSANKITKDPRAYALQEYYRQYDPSKLDAEGKWSGRKNPAYSFDKEYDSTIGKLPENQRRVLMNRGRDWYYRNINNPAPGVPNSNYYDTWYGRIWNTNEYAPFNPNDPRFVPKKQIGGNIQPAMAGANQTVPMAQLGDSIKPIPMQLAMGGSLPGAVGFTYARTINPAPSNGPYAKKTKASAQNGMEMKYYQEGLDFKPKTISQDGAVIDPMGYWNPENWGNPVIIPSTDITMQGVDQPLIGISDTGDVQYMEPGEDYEFDGEYVTEYPVAQAGKIIYVSDPKDPRLRAYQDSSNLYKAYQFQKSNVNPQPMLERLAKELTKHGQPTTPQELRKIREKNLKNVKLTGSYKSVKSNPTQGFDPLEKELGDEKIYNYYKSLQFNEPVAIGKYSSPDIFHKTIKPTGTYYDGIAASPIYKQPVQPVVYKKPDPRKPEPRDPVFIPRERIEFDGGVPSTLTPRPLNIPAREMPSIIQSTPKEAEEEREIRVRETPIRDFLQEMRWKMQQNREERQIKRGTRKQLKCYAGVCRDENGNIVARDGVSVNEADAQPIKKLDQLLNFTNYNKPTKGGWLDKYN